MKENPYHKPAGTYKPIVVPNINKMTAGERLQLMLWPAPPAKK